MVKSPESQRGLTAAVLWQPVISGYSARFPT